MKQYLDLLQDVITNGVWKEPAREGMPRTKEVFGRMMKFDLCKGFPLLTTKKMFFTGIVTELLWFLHGSTNIKYLIENECNIWTPDAYKYYCRICKAENVEPISKEEFINKIKSPKDVISIETPFEDRPFYKYGDCGQIYGYQWRNFNGHFDQIKEVINNIKQNPDSRYHIVTAWNPVSFSSHPHFANQAALPACHMLFQFCVQDGVLHLSMTQRSADTFLGVPFNIASYALLLHIIAAECGLQAGEFTWFGNSVHIYENHFDAVKEQLSRDPYKLPELLFVRKPLDEYEIADFVLKNYVHHPAIKAPLSVGV